MRLAGWLRLIVLVSIVGSFQATAFARMSPPVAETKKPLINEEFIGYGKTVTGARNDALAHASVWLEEKSGLGWTPHEPYLLEHNLVRFSEPDDKEFEPPMGVMKVVKLRLEIRADQARDIQKQAQQQRMKERQKCSLLVVFGAVGLLGLVGGYLWLEEATKGYYTRLLRVLAATAVLAWLTGLLLPLLARVVPH